ncbi:MAG: carbohydrate ABC transporter permease [Halobacteriaceae archaeon]
MSIRSTLAVYRRRFARSTIEASRWERVALYASVLLIVLVSIFPFYWMLYTSLVPASRLYLTDPQLLLPGMTLRSPLPAVTLENYRQLLTAETVPFIQYFINSVVIATISAALGLLFSIFGAYSFARLDYPGQAIFSRGVLVTYMFAGILMVIPIYQILIWLGLVNTRAGVILTHFTFVIPLGLYMLGNFFRSIPQEIEEAALMDGYSRLEVIVKITIPMSLPAIFAVYLYSFILSWNEYLYAKILLKDSELYTLPIGIENIQTAFQNVWGEVMAASILTTIPVLVMFLYLQKYLIEGLNFGSMD